MEYSSPNSVLLGIRSVTQNDQKKQKDTEILTGKHEERPHVDGKIILK